MEYQCENGHIYLTQEDFDLDQTLDCGQAFRWQRQSDGSYKGYAGAHFLHIAQTGTQFVLYHTSEDAFLSFWANYFDLHTDYGAYKHRLSEDATLREACAYASGIRLLRQDAWEALISFILSQNNNITRIKGIIARLCEVFDGHFPSPQELASADAQTLAPLRAGFRVRYLLDAAEKVASDTVNLNAVAAAPLDDARAMLMQICGVGEKVADCAMLYGFHKLNVLPRDVWIKRVLAQFYPDGFPPCTHEIEGIAQQYLFHFIRTCPTVENAQ